MKQSCAVILVVALIVAAYFYFGIYSADFQSVVAVNEVQLRSSSAANSNLLNDFQSVGNDFRKAQRLAEFVYNVQKFERKSPFDSIFAHYTPNFPCLWGEEAVGTIETWTEKWDKFKDGWKFVCGLRRITSPCIVYSLGSSGNMAFEKGLLQVNPSCQVYIFDKDDYSVADWFPDEKMRSNVRFQRAFIALKDDPSHDPPLVSLKSVMKSLNHSHIDILKMDIEGSEWKILQSTLPSIGQLQVELHLSLASQSSLPGGKDIMAYTMENLEKQGFRMFHKETNMYDPSCGEFAFIQSQWTPHEKSYT